MDAGMKRGMVCVVATAILGGFLAGVWMGNLTGPQYEFQSKVHGYMENAYWANTPELMITQLNYCMDGMRDVGLTEDMYGKFWSWKQTPDWRMDYCYAHIGAIIDRCNEVISWRDGQDLSSGQVTDVYNQKMENLRDFLKEGGWSDEIAYNAFYINHHSFYYIWWWAIGGLLLVVAGLSFARVLNGDDESGWYVAWIICSLAVILVVAYVILGK